MRGRGRPTAWHTRGQRRLEHNAKQGVLLSNYMFAWINKVSLSHSLNSYAWWISVLPSTSPLPQLASSPHDHHYALEPILDWIILPLSSYVASLSFFFVLSSIFLFEALTFGWLATTLSSVCVFVFLQSDDSQLPHRRSTCLTCWGLIGLQVQRERRPMERRERERDSPKTLRHCDPLARPLQPVPVQESFVVVVVFLFLSFFWNFVSVVDEWIVRVERLPI